MDKKNSDKVKNLIIILSFILIVIALLIAIIIFTYKMSNEPSDNTTEIQYLEQKNRKLES